MNPIAVPYESYIDDDLDSIDIPPQYLLVKYTSSPNEIEFDYNSKRQWPTNDDVEMVTCCISDGWFELEHNYLFSEVNSSQTYIATCDFEAEYSKLPNEEDYDVLPEKPVWNYIPNEETLLGTCFNAKNETFKSFVKERPELEHNYCYSEVKNSQSYFPNCDSEAKYTKFLDEEDSDDLPETPVLNYIPNEETLNEKNALGNRSPFWVNSNEEPLMGICFNAKNETFKSFVKDDSDLEFVADEELDTYMQTQYTIKKESTIKQNKGGNNEKQKIKYYDSEVELGEVDTHMQTQNKIKKKPTKKQNKKGKNGKQKINHDDSELGIAHVEKVDTHMQTQNKIKKKPTKKQNKIGKNEIQRINHDDSEVKFEEVDTHMQTQYTIRKESTIKQNEGGNNDDSEVELGDVDTHMQTQNKLKKKATKKQNKKGKNGKQKINQDDSELGIAHVEKVDTHMQTQSKIKKKPTKKQNKIGKNEIQRLYHDEWRDLYGRGFEIWSLRRQTRSLTNNNTRKNENEEINHDNSDVTPSKQTRRQTKKK